MSTGKRNGGNKPHNAKSFINRNYRAFTNDLRTLMSEYPSLPVVPIISKAGAKYFEASIAYIYDKDNEFLEKCIAITDEVAETSIHSWIDVDDELPFN